MDSYKGKIFARKGNSSQEPMVVYVLGKSAHCTEEEPLYVTEKLNTGITVFSPPQDLVEYDHVEFTRMKKKWKMRDVLRQAAILRKELLQI